MRVANLFRESCVMPAAVRKSSARAIAAPDPNNKRERMKRIFEATDVKRDAIALRKVIPFWFAVSSPLLGMLLGVLGAWVLTWLTT
jgi:hypothetical protein